MVTMNIKDPEVHRLANELARIRRTSATAAVRSALEHELERVREPVVIDWGRIEHLRERLAPASADWLTDDELYDDEGLPR